MVSFVGDGFPPAFAVWKSTNQAGITHPDSIMKFSLPLFLTLALLLTACEDQPPPVELDESMPMEMETATPGETESLDVLTEADNGTSVSLAVGEVLIVRLGSNPSTGYSWQVREIGDNLVQVGESAYEATPVDEQIVGSGGHETWRFEAVSAGESTLELHYRQPFDDEAESAETWRIDVTVE